MMQSPLRMTWLVLTAVLGLAEALRAEEPPQTATKAAPTSSDKPGAGSFSKDLRALVQRVVEQLLSDPYAAVLLSLMDAAERSPDLAALLAAAQAKLVEAVRTVLARARVRGELPRLPDPSDVAALIVGPLLYRRLFSHEPLSEGFFRLIVDNVVRTAGAPSSRRVRRAAARAGPA